MLAGVPSIALAGQQIATLTRHQVVELIERELSAGRGGFVITTNVDHLQRCSREPEIRALYESAQLVVADGMPLLWAARLQRTPLPDRVAGSDLVWLLAEQAARCGRSIYLLGGAEGAAEAAVGRLRERYPGLRIAGWSAPSVSAVPTDSEVAAIAEELARVRPDLVYVGLGAPKQERLMARLEPHLPNTWLLGIGISLSFIADQVRRAPNWMQRSGLEWVHRLAQEPHRLARRYLIDDLPFLVRLLCASVAARAAASREGFG